MLAESSIIQRLDDPAVALCVLVMLGVGIKLGVFRTTLVGFGLVLSLLLALGLCMPAADLLTRMEVPAGYATLIAFAVVFLGGVAAVVAGVTAGIRESAVRLPMLADGGLGSLAGGLCGIVLAAAVHIGWSMIELPEDYRFKADEVEFRVGEAMLGHFAGFADVDADEPLTRYRTGQWVGPLPRPEPEEGTDATPETEGSDEMNAADDDPRDDARTDDASTTEQPPRSLSETGSSEAAGARPETRSLPESQP
jgi:hypothetical protein